MSRGRRDSKKGKEDRKEDDSGMNSKESSTRIIRDYGLTILGAVLIALAVRFFLVEAYKIPGAGMKPALLPGDTLFVSKSTFGFHLPGSNQAFTQGRAPRYGEVIVYSRMGNPPRDSIKRVIGLPGDTVEIKKGRVTLNGTEISKSEKPDSNCGTETLPQTKTHIVCWESPLPEDMPAHRLGASELFLMADLRSEIYDGRKQPPWDISTLAALKGSAWIIWLSVEPESGSGNSVFSRLRLERMFKAVN